MVYMLVDKIVAWDKHCELFPINCSCLARRSALVAHPEMIQRD
jgi:hypothetical protein